MVESATSLGRSGLQDWLVQRVSAVILTLYIGVLVFYLLLHSDFNYLQWQHLFETSWMRSFSLLALLSLVAHSWVGVWTISTDYIKLLWLRLMFQIIIILSLFYYVVWGVQIIWHLN